MAKADRTELRWTEIDPDTLHPDTLEAYKSYKQAYAEMKRIRQGFEDHMQSYAPEGKRLVFGYNFGKLSVAVTEAKAEKAKPQAKQSLADYLSGMSQSGRRV